VESDGRDNDGRCENGAGVVQKVIPQGDSSDDSSDKSSLDESDSVVFTKWTASCSTSSSSHLMSRSSKQLTSVPVLAKNKRSKQARAFQTS